VLANLSNNATAPGSGNAASLSGQRRQRLVVVEGLEVMPQRPT
jgi:hypothetical protein